MYRVEVGVGVSFSLDGEYHTLADAVARAKELQASGWRARVVLWIVLEEYK